MKDIDPAVLEKLRDGAKADLAAASLGEAVQLMIQAADLESRALITMQDLPSVATA
jgi:hypothetical protein